MFGRRERGMARTWVSLPSASGRWREGGASRACARRALVASRPSRARRVSALRASIPDASRVRLEAGMARRINSIADLTGISFRDDRTVENLSI